MPPPEKCVRCGRLGHDRRRLWMRCGYQMQELSVPFEEATIHDLDDGPPRFFYTLKVCKGCRGDWMASIESWFKAKPTFIEINDGEVLVEDIPPDPQEARIRELEQELATANSLCRIAEEKVGRRTQKLEKANDRICDLIEDMSGADNRIMEIEEKGKVQPDRHTCEKSGKTSWVDGQLQFTCPKCKHTKRKLRYVQPIGHVGHVAPDPGDMGCTSKCFKGQHLHLTCSDCGYAQWDFCADHVEEQP